MPKPKKRNHRAKKSADRSEKPLSPLEIPELAETTASVQKALAAPAPYQIRNLGKLVASLAAVLIFLVAFELASDIHGLTNSQFDSSPANHKTTLRGQFQTLSQDAKKFKEAEADDEIQIVRPDLIDTRLSAIKTNLDAGNNSQARTQITSFKNDLTSWEQQLGNALVAHSSTVPTEGGIQVPILIYHYTPPDFDAILSHLQAAGYHDITPEQLAAALHGTASLPTKPVLLTFDDGFANQMTAFRLLRKHNMKATFYIIDGGQHSRWCIGASRHYDQHPGCGDAYLNWDEVRQLDRSGLITIGAHTIDHENLATVTPSEQHYQIIDGKQELEKQLGHPVKDFAYPYGGYNGTTLALVQQAGFETAVTTKPGDIQTLAGILTMPRIRDAMTLH
jgi:peptidoglycan/xylan/chitin deacetylase (PgdA/CDA1 family)